MGRKPFNNLLLKNTVAVALPAIVLFVVLFYMFSRYPVLDRVKCYELSELEETEVTLGTMLAEGRTNLSVDAKNLFYTGFDYLVDGKLTGAYYYTEVGEKKLLLLIKTDVPEMFLPERTVKGKLKKDSMRTEHILTAFAIEQGIDPVLVEGLMSDFIISEPDYPYAYVIMIYVFFVLPLALALVIAVYTLLVAFRVELNPQTKQLAVYGDCAEIIYEVNEQMRNRMVFRKNNIYVTADYLIVSFFTKTNVVKLSEVMYISKNELPRRKKFRLTLSTPGKLFYEVDFKSEVLIDDVLEYIRGNDFYKLENQ